MQIDILSILSVIITLISLILIAGSSVLSQIFIKIRARRILNFRKKQSRHNKLKSDQKQIRTEIHTRLEVIQKLIKMQETYHRQKTKKTD